ncbi:MFS transporter [Pseudoclavibacter endophyticus]|uniref:MFS transporter n=1 Tax=Pseudoclavibacter endophyticus TaxID=1778590 RepID=UPI0019CDF63D|nr:MFS transporter [Pseudoclavibacter endophyticus]GGA71079.1 MFS transporter [Pseudoclavibacter endophyticus]
MGDEANRRRLTYSVPKWLTVLALAFTGLTSAYMFTLVVPIQSELPHLLDAPREDTAWVVTITLLVAACATPISGRLGDMYGKRRIVLILIGFLLLGSVVAALSTNIAGVIVGRGLQGATTGVVPLGIAIMRDVLPRKRLGSAVALMSATMGVGGSVGMPVSAFIVENFDWHALFWVAAGLGVISLVLVIALVPESVLRTAGRFDFLGVVGLSIGLAGILLAISRGADWGWFSPATLGSGLGGVVVLLIWGWYQLRASAPLIDLRVAARPAVLFTNLTAICMGFALFGNNVLLPQLLELPTESGAGFGLGMFETALLVMPAGLLMMLISPISGWLEGKIGARAMLAIGSGAVALSYVYLLIWSDEIFHLFIANLIVGVGIGLSFAAMPMLIMRSVPAEETGVSNGINALARSLGTSTASAVMAAVLAAVSIDYNGVAVPTATAFNISFWIGAIVGIGAMVLSLLIPLRPFQQHHPSVPRD